MRRSCCTCIEWSRERRCHSVKDGWEISSPPLALLLSHPWPPPISQLPQLSAKHSTAKTAAGWSSLMPKTGLSNGCFPPQQSTICLCCTAERFGKTCIHGAIFDFKKTLCEKISFFQQLFWSASSTGVKCSVTQRCKMQKLQTDGFSDFHRAPVDWEKNKDQIFIITLYLTVLIIIIVVGIPPGSACSVNTSRQWTAVGAHDGGGRVTLYRISPPNPVLLLHTVQWSNGRGVM